MTTENTICITPQIWDSLKIDIIFRLTLIERAGYQEDIRIGFYNGEEDFNQIESPLRESLLNLSIDRNEYYEVFDGFPPHTEECIKMNDLSFIESCSCQESKK